ncbi:ATP-dependent dethiobiotin synthetase BioD [Euhalothece natronophila Z-M001]|uniref:ATP-dependent dethiobiotin synthetase BioD n=1 Tax=Euhalothece natronophila Z-M001 TaxID=522448 RepID=A0A5B8NL76_9CHRO|nr:dethiobiotin synthase [Euhalothece natronophila]QDZ39281.1 ATP-dependent dethiobiotin synthetase BioD [Euhalothece natronophila Z-M001]
MTTLLITGTDTEIGKTVVTLSLTAYWHKYCAWEKLGIMKLIQTGSPGDSHLYQQLFQWQQETALINPVSYQSPIAPPLAAEKENQPVNLTTIWEGLTTLQSQKEVVLVEALGGLGSPITFEMTVADIAAAWQLPIILVVPVKLGAIAQTVANVALARQHQVSIKGVIFNCVSAEAENNQHNWTPSELISNLCQVPILGTIPYLSNPSDLEKLAQVASNLELEYLW